MATQTFAVYVRDSKNENWRHYASNLPTEEDAKKIAKDLRGTFFGVQASGKVNPPSVLG